jgi:hypothetical protein
MAKIKSSCSDCGNTCQIKKLKLSAVDSRPLCSYCYRQENKQRNGLFWVVKRKTKEVVHITENKERLLRRAKNCLEECFK